MKGGHPGGRDPAACSALAALPLGVALLSCGPSFQAVYEGNAHFEHCYALEENPQASMPDKAACWRDWSEHYTYGQTRDRVLYATARYVALSEARNIPTDEALMMAAPGETPRVSTITAPAPTNAFAPPPKILDPADPAALTSHPNAPMSVPASALDAGALATAAAPTLPATSCVDGCAGDYRGCVAACDMEARVDAGSASAKACQKCRSTYRTCMRGCFK